MEVYVLSSIFCGMIIALGLRLKRTLTSVQPENNDEERSLAFYAPMERLLSETDFRFLRGRAEVPKSAIRQLRSDRRRVFRKYLGYLSVDFSAITRELRAITLESDVSRPDLARSLFRMQIVFLLAVLALEARLALHACGIHTISISASRLTEGLATLRVELRQIQSIPALSAV